MSNSYNYCKVCTIKVPRIFSDIHAKQCHHSSKQLFCNKLHPLIKDGELVSQINIIRDTDEGLSSTGKLGSWCMVEEPEFMKHFNYDFTEKFAFFNELDLYHGHIESFTHICVQVGSLQAVFVAVSVNCDKQQIGTVHFYEKGLKKHFPIQHDTSFVTVKRINRVIEAKKVKLTISSPVDEVFVRCRFKKKFLTNYEYGFPYLFRRKSDSVTLQNLENNDFVVNIEIEDSDLFNLSVFSNVISVENMSLNITMDSFKNCSLIDNTNENIESMDVSTAGDSVEGISPRRNFRSSTPTCEERLANSSSNAIRIQKSNSHLLTTTHSSETDYNSLTYYWLSYDTKIEIVTSVSDDHTHTNDSKAKKFQNIVPRFYKTKEFYFLKDMITRKLEMEEDGQIPYISWSGILLLGLPGTGKTTIIEELSKDIKIPLITVNILEYTRSGRSSNYITDCFAKARNCAPSILFFDGFDCFTHKSQAKFADKILKSLKISKSLTKTVIFVAATNRPELISPHMRQMGRFDKDVVISLPDAETRAGILWQILDGQSCNISRDEAITLGKNSLGFSPADIDFSVRVACQKSIRKHQSKLNKEEEDKGVCLRKEDLEDGIREVVPSHLRDKYFSISKVRWQDIWGYENIKEKLKKITKVQSTERCSKGILLYGPPGCSKTMMARALATETHFSFFPIKCSDLLSKYVGETEKALCDMLEKANLSSPSLVFIDEIDSLCGRQGGGGSESCVVPELLSLMRKAYNTGNILFVGATNRPHVLDEALLSAGYFELLFHVDLPNCESRCEIWKGLLQGVPYNDINTLTLCNRTERFTCAEICSIYQKAAYSLIEAKVLGLENEIPTVDLKLTEDLIMRSLSSKSPRTSKSVLETIRTFASTRGS